MLLSAVFGFVFVLSFTAVVNYFGLQFFLITALVIVSMPLMTAAEFFLTRSRIRARLRQHLADEGYPICRVCGYDVRATLDRCPECGTRFTVADARWD